jgi:hypothetical protein
MHAFMQSLQMRWPVAAASGLSTTMIASAASARPRVFAMWNSEIFSSSGQPASVTPNGLFLNATRCGSSAGAFSRRPLEHESLPCAWHQMQ